MGYPIFTPYQLSFSLKSWRKSLNLTQVEAGQRVGLLPKTISALESYPERCTIESLFKLLSALNLEISLNAKQSKAGDSQQGEW